MPLAAQSVELQRERGEGRELLQCESVIFEFVQVLVVVTSFNHIEMKTAVSRNFFCVKLALQVIKQHNRRRHAVKIGVGRAR